MEPTPWQRGGVTVPWALRRGQGRHWTYMARSVVTRKKSLGEARKRIDLIFKPLVAQLAETLTGRDFQLLADGYASQSSAAYAVRSIRPALRWAAQRGYLSEDTAWIHPPAPVQRRKRILSRDELTNSRLSAAVTPTCPSCPGSRSRIRSH